MVVASIMKQPEGSPQDPSNHNYLCYIRSENGRELGYIPAHMVKKSFLTTFPSHSNLIIGLKLAVNPPYLQEATLMHVKNPKVIQELSAQEQKMFVRSYKFGVLYAKEGQTTEEQIYSNVATSPAYEDFLNFLGDRIRLKGWDKYDAGLDVEGDRMGTESIYTEWKGLDIMYHVSTLLPHSPNDVQQLQRKCHIGNDVVVIIFQDGNTPFSPKALVSQFNHVIILIRHEKRDGKDFYRVGVCSKDFPDFGPALPDPPVFEKTPEFREFLLTKMVNGERAAYHSQKLSKGIKRTVGMFLKELFDQYLQEPLNTQNKGTKTTPRRSKLLSGIKRGDTSPTMIFPPVSSSVNEFPKYEALPKSIFSNKPRNSTKIVSLAIEPEAKLSEKKE
eukprot:TRINITY_DN2080_c1_g2_i2.p1 TRINITY_DN2080_c1_g2~~TRINITY_DN2080_c1_g2_i2.p1  ORF type:complete len:388 (-),score=95.72 TRINITY_DN2080_c1_g2_i2:905-2068(-)